MQEGGYDKVEAEAPRTWWGWGSSSTSSADLSTSATQPPSSGGVVFYPPWRTEVLRQVNVRDGLQRRPFVDLIRQQHVFVKERTMMRDKMYMLDKEVLHLKQLIGELKRPDGDTTAGDGDVQRLQQELTECYKRNSETAQEVIELNRRVKELTETLNAKQDQLAENERICEALKDELRGKVGALRTLTPELESLKAELARSEDRNKKLEEENAHMLTQWKLKNSEDARKMNEVNEFFQQMQHMQHLAKNPPGHSSDSSIEAVAAVGEDRRKGRAHAGSSVPRRAATQLRAHTGDVTSVAYSASGDRIASGSTDMTVKIWGLNGDLQSTLTGAKLAITQVEFAPEDRDLVLASSCDNVARVWSVSSGKVKHTLRGHVAKVTGSTFMSAGKVITGSHDRTVKVWDLDKGYCVRTVFCYNPCNAVAFVGRSLLCSAHVDRRIRLWDLKTSDAVGEVQDVQAKQATSISWTPACEDMVLTTAPDNTAQLIDLRNLKSAQIFRPPQGGVLSPQACLSADGNFVVAGSTTGGIFVWNTHTGALEANIAEGHQAGVSCCTWKLKGKPLVTGGSDASLLIWSS